MGNPLLGNGWVRVQYFNAILVSAAYAQVHMFFLVIGIVLLAMKYLEMGPVATWSWFVVLAPFALAVAWWTWADASGYTKKKAIERENAKKQARIDKNKEALGIKTKRR